MWSQPAGAFGVASLPSKMLQLLTHPSRFCRSPVLKVRGFFKGMALPLTTVSMTSSVAFGTYRNCLHCLSQARGAGGGPNTKMEVFLSGLAGGVVQVRLTD